MSNFTQLFASGSSSLATMAIEYAPIDAFESSVATGSGTKTLLGQYFMAPESGELLDLVLVNPPNVQDVVMYALRSPGGSGHTQAVGLLAHMIGQTLQFAIQFETFDRFMRPVYAHETWELIFSALGYAEGIYGEFCYRWVSQRAENDTDVTKRLAAFDARESLSEIYGALPGAPG